MFNYNLVVSVSFKSLFQDRLTFRRIIVKNNAKKRKMYEAFIETLPLLTSLEVRGLVLQCLDTACIYSETIVNQKSFHLQLSERMKVVDVLSTKVYSDSQQIIAQVMNLFVWSVPGLVFLFHGWFMFIYINALCYRVI